MHLISFPLYYSITEVLPVFCWVLSFLVVFARWAVLPLVSILTFFKGSLLLATVSNQLIWRIREHPIKQFAHNHIRVCMILTGHF